MVRRDRISWFHVYDDPDLSFPAFGRQVRFGTFFAECERLPRLLRAYPSAFLDKYVKNEFGYEDTKVKQNDINN